MGFSRQEYWSGVPLPSPEQGLLSSYGVLASHCSGLSFSGAWTLGGTGSVVAAPRLYTGSVVVAHRLSCPRYVGSSWIRDWTHVSCAGRRILYHWATRDAQCSLNIMSFASIRSSHTLLANFTNCLWRHPRYYYLKLHSLSEKTELGLKYDLCFSSKYSICAFPQGQPPQLNGVH